MRRFTLAALAASLAVPALADTTEGLVLAYDRAAQILVLADKTVWTLPGDLAVPANLGHGDRVFLEFTSQGEDGMGPVDALSRLAVALPADTDGGS